MSYFDTPDKKRAAIGTIIFHLVLLLVFIFCGLTQPDPLPEEEGFELALTNLGTTQRGSGTVRTPNPAPANNPVNEEQAQPVQPVATPQTAEPTEATTEENSEVALPKEKEPEETKTPPKEKPTETPKEVEPAEKTPEKIPEEKPKKPNPMALYKGSQGTNNSSSNGGSQGNSDGIGNEGTASGKPSGKGVLGGGGGSWELSGRGLLRTANIETTKEEGTVVVDIFVDRYGNVTRAQPNLAESNTASQYLFDLAVTAAKKTKYTPKADAAVEQKGKMTFVFILK